MTKGKNDKISDLFVPSYVPVHAVQAFQDVMGYLPGTESDPNAQPISFGNNEYPRWVSSTVITPSWFRYANMGPYDDYQPAVPAGMHWDVQYYRREDGVLITNPVLVPIPVWKDPRAPTDVTLSQIARNMYVPEDELTDEGIEDISSDDDLYRKAEASDDQDASVGMSFRDTSASTIHSGTPSTVRPSTPSTVRPDTPSSLPVATGSFHAPPQRPMFPNMHGYMSRVSTKRKKSSNLEVPKLDDTDEVEDAADGGDEHEDDDEDEGEEEHEDDDEDEEDEEEDEEQMYFEADDPEDLDWK